MQPSDAPRLRDQHLLATAAYCSVHDPDARSRSRSKRRSAFHPPLPLKRQGHGTQDGQQDGLC